jgi:uncharacterized protein (DUF305 family)
MIRILSLLTLVGLALFPVGGRADGPADGRAGRAEVRFMQGMIDHHQMALDMAAHCLDHAVTDAVRALCSAIIAAQTPEIEQMQAWLLAWYDNRYQPVSMRASFGDAADAGHAGHGGHGDHGAPASDPPMTMGMMAGLTRLQGVAYDIAWLEAMIDHHDDAIHMSERLLRRVQHDELRDLAVRIIAAQSAEIAQMEALIRELGGSNGEA